MFTPQLLALRNYWLTGGPLVFLTSASSADGAIGPQLSRFLGRQNNPLITAAIGTKRHSSPFRIPQQRSAFLFLDVFGTFQPVAFFFAGTIWHQPRAKSLTQGAQGARCHAHLSSHSSFVARQTHVFTRKPRKHPDGSPLCQNYIIFVII